MEVEGRTQRRQQTTFTHPRVSDFLSQSHREQQLKKKCEYLNHLVYSRNVKAVRTGARLQGDLFSGLVTIRFIRNQS